MRKLAPLFVFSIAFGFVEAAIVVYLRRLFGFSLGYPSGGYSVAANLGVIAFLKPGSMVLPDSTITQIEILREIATLIMLCSVAAIVGKSKKNKFGALLVAFSLWDIFYYIFLKVLIGWPNSLFDTDVFFLNPVPWIGPVITPLVIFCILLLLGLKLLKD